MRIESSAISMTSKSNSIKLYKREESLRTWNDKSNSENSKKISDLLLSSNLDIFELSDEAKAMLSTHTPQLQNVKLDDAACLELSDKDKLKILAVQKMIEALTGKKINFVIPKKLNLTDFKPINVKIQPIPRNGWGLEYNLQQSYYEQEEMAFTSKGIVKTSDGREIDFSLNVNISREFYSENEINIRAGDAIKIDPLVINFSDSVPLLTNEKFSFDIDSNGSLEQISTLAPGNGFLALDLNGNDKVNNGSELFGPNTGDGFSELSKYDFDGNNWIDENDEIFNKLRIWTKDEKGNDVLFALGQKGIGAIYLGNISTPFDMKDQQNNLEGSVSKSGIYLKEKGTVGVIQHIDMAV